MNASTLRQAKSPGPRRDKRRGLTLMEVIVAMAIFVMSLAAIVPLMTMGLNRAVEVELQSVALQKAQSKMSEVLAGAVQLGSQTNVPFDEDPTGQWTWSMEAEQDGTIGNLWNVTVTVSHPVADSEVKVSLTEKVRDPSIMAPWTSNQLASLNSSTATGANSTGGTTGGTTGNTGNTGGGAAPAAAPAGGTKGGATGGGATGGGATGGGAMGGGATGGGAAAPAAGNTGNTKTGGTGAAPAAASKTGG
jgi:prepilin-type N-terminal cleavage/methylation domain-containing protein